MITEEFHSSDKIYYLPRGLNAIDLSAFLQQKLLILCLVAGALTSHLVNQWAQ